MSRYHSEVCLRAARPVPGRISRALRALPGAYGTIVYAFWVLCFPFSVFFTMGVDHTVNLYIVTALRLALPLLLAGLLSRVAFGFGPLVAATGPARAHQTTAPASAA